MLCILPSTARSSEVEPPPHEECASISISASSHVHRAAGRSGPGSNETGCTTRSCALSLGSSPQDIEGQPLATWLLDQQCSEQGPGIGYLDLREVTPENQRRIIDGLHLALRQARSEGPLGWSDPSAFDAWLSSFDFLLRLVDSVERGEAPDAVSDPNVRLLMPPTGERRGPGS
jgi:hypothetical protein